MVKPLTPQQMVEVRAFAPFEIVEVMKEWCCRWSTECSIHSFATMHDEHAQRFMEIACDGLGAPVRHTGETSEEYGLRIATAIFTLIKEI